MSRRPGSRPRSGQRGGPKLPFAMRERLGLSEDNKRQWTQVADRKQKRRDARKLPAQKHRTQRIVAEEDLEEDDSDALGGLDDVSYDSEMEIVAEMPKPAESRGSIRPAKRKSPSPDLSLGEEDTGVEEDMGFDPVGGDYDAFDSDDDLSRGSREYSPEVVLDSTSRTFQDRQAEEDAEILALEKKLGGKNKKTADVNGFDALLGGLDDGDSKKRKREGREWLEQKRRRVDAQKPVEPEPKSSEDNLSERDEDTEESEGEDFKGFEDEDDVDEATNATLKVSKTKTPSVRENPYVAPIPANGAATAKYVPPSRRKPPETDTEKLNLLRRQAQGSLNKLSEANIISIVDEFDRLYQNNPRQDMNTVLFDLILAAFVIHSSLPNTFIILHTAFIAALYKILGADFGAEMIVKLTDAFDSYHNEFNATGKEPLNLISLLANLFTFNVISSALVYDHVRLLLSDFNENNAELLLRIMRDCGPQLRADDPTALKGIVQMMNDVSARMSSNGQTINVRTRVMMDTITDLKNNKTRQATNAAGATGEHLTRMRKALGSLNNRQLRATEPLGITRADILNSDKKGKWWLVGASWKGHSQQQQLASKSLPTSKKNIQPTPDFDDDELDYNQLFQSQSLHLTLPLHRTLFIAITSATDAPDALARIQKLRLTKKQELENIAPVILRACRAEQVYNSYYAVVSRLLLRERRFKMSFAIALWKFFGNLGERQDADGDSDDEYALRDGEQIGAGEIANVARMYASLVAKGCVRLDVLKTLNVGFTRENATLFLEVLFIGLLGNSKLKEKGVVEVFSGVEPRQAKSIGYFLKKVVRNSDIVGSKEEARKVKEGCKMAVAALAAMERGAIDDEDDQ